MKRFITYLIIGAVLIGTSYSCLKIDNTTLPSRGEEQINLKKYLDDIISRGNDVDTTELGVYYVTINEGTGTYPKTGDTLTVGYAGYFIDGGLFDASYWHNQTDSTYTFVLGNPPLIKGWDDGMKVISKNARVQLIIPSDFAYGSTGSGFILPYQTLIFVIVMKDIKPSN
ncbi:MAG TPA: FKBP-type peptidyl-prolyl cis-trans isomerase [Draconibacterium sp.]|jgi:FKBP-type peptidyl-prolyl cis-trans isomerase FkpA|nr:FKBP-type peptidyl-prolyl cis-trans isomerase [Draconibacterium sp.]